MENEQVKAIVSAIVVIMVQCAAMFGISLDGDAVQTVVSAVVLLATTVYAIWKNHNFTTEACEAQKVLDELKEGDE